MREIGLALSGGGARGIAHLGVLAALDELEIPIGRLVGVSSGAIVGTFYAAGYAPKEVLRLFTAMSITRLLRPAFSKHGLLHLDAVQRLIEEQLGANFTFADLKIPLTLVATDLLEGVSVYFTEGPLLPPLLGSSAVPVLYRPVAYQGRQLVDGGLLNNLPIDPLLDQDLIVVGVHCNPVNPAARITTFRSLVERTLLLGINANTPARRLCCDLLIEPPDLRHFRTLSYRRATELYDIGYRHTLSLAPQLRALQ